MIPAVRPTATPADRGGRRAFTLAELLVTVAILALLISLLVPYAGRAMEKARLTACRKHLRNVSVGLAAYLDDHDDALPVAEQLDNPHADLLGSLCGPYVAGEDFYCPSQTDPRLCYSQDNLDACSIGYFYYSCRRASRNRGVSTFLRWEVCWPREMNSNMDPGLWVMSDCWFSGEPTAHRWYKKGVNYLTLGGEVLMVTESPRQAFR